MEYHIKITKFEDNPKYEEEMKEWRERTRYSGMHPDHDSSAPRQKIEVRVLETTLTENEFDLLRRTAIQSV